MHALRLLATSVSSVPRDDVIAPGLAALSPASRAKRGRRPVVLEARRGRNEVFHEGGLTHPQAIQKPAFDVGVLSRLAPGDSSIPVAARLRDACGSVSRAPGLTSVEVVMAWQGEADLRNDVGLLRAQSQPRSSAVLTASARLRVPVLAIAADR